MRVCYANDGVNIYDHLFIDFLVNRGHEVHVVTFCPPQGTDETQQGFPTTRDVHIHHSDMKRFLGIRNMTGLEGFFKIAVTHIGAVGILSSLIRRIKPDVLNGHFITNYGLWSALSFYHPFLLTIWGSDILILPSQLKTGKFVAMFVLKMADAVIVDSIVQKQAAVNLGCNPWKIVSFPWAADLERFNPKVSGERVRISLGWEENPIIFCTRWHKPIYGVRYLLYAVPEITQEQSNARFMIGGCGPQTDEFKGFVEEKGLEKYVKFVGKIPPEKMPGYMAACDIYVSPSLSDGTSASLLEAMACSKPVVVSNIPGNLEWVTNNVNGFTVPMRDVKALAGAISELLKEESLRKKFGTKNFEIVMERADLRKGLQLYEDTLMTLASRRR